MRLKGTFPLNNFRLMTSIVGSHSESIRGGLGVRNRTRTILN
jgi:hypothetical protein